MQIDHEISMTQKCMGSFSIPSKHICALKVLWLRTISDHFPKHSPTWICNFHKFHGRTPSGLWRSSWTESCPTLLRCWTMPGTLAVMARFQGRITGEILGKCHSFSGETRSSWNSNLAEGVVVMVERNVFFHHKRWTLDVKVGLLKLDPVISSQSYNFMFSIRATCHVAAYLYC